MIALWQAVITSPLDHQEAPDDHYYYTACPLLSPLAREAPTPGAPRTPPRGEGPHVTLDTSIVSGRDFVVERRVG